MKPMVSWFVMVMTVSSGLAAGQIGPVPPFTSLNSTGNVFQTVNLVPNPITASGAAVSVAVADFNGDGKPDIAVPGTGCNTCGVTILRGNGDGTFQSALFTLDLGGPSYVAAGDFNGDGKADLAVLGLLPTNLTVPALYILLGNGDGTFTLTTTVPGFSAPQSLTLADFNGDGKLDVAVVDTGSNTVTVLLGNGDGTLQTPIPTAGLGTGFARYAAAADFNRDGKTDLVVGDQNSGHVVVLLGNGNGTFQTARSFPLAFAAGGYDVAAGDFNDDGIPDIAATNPAAGTVNVLLGMGDGNFQPAVAYNAAPLDGQTSNLAIADFNKDGEPDIITSVNSSTVAVLFGKGDGTFSAPLLLAANEFPGQLAVADFNADGNLDWVAGSTSQQFLTLGLGNGNGTFRASVNYATGATPQITAADINHDGSFDLVTSNLGSNNISVLLGNGDGSFQAAINTPVSQLAGGIAAGDLNGDGNPDVVVGSSAGVFPRNVTVLLGNGKGTFAGPLSFSTGGSGEGQIALADLNGDGKLDIAIVNQSDNTISVLPGNGDGTFQTAKITPALAADTFLGALIAADLNGDGKMDLAIPDYSLGEVVVLVGNGDGTFQPPAYYTAALGATGLTVADFNKDGKLDLATADQFGTVAVLLGNGDGTFGAPTILDDTQPIAGVGRINTIPIVLLAGDFNLDGNVDLLVGDAQPDVGVPGLSVANWNFGVQLFSGHGDGTFSPSQNYLAGNQTTSMAAGDFNRDGALDVAVAAPLENAVTVLLNQTPPAVTVSPKNLSFGSQFVGTTSASQPVNVSNHGAAATTMSIAAAGDFTQTNTCPVSPATLAVGGTCVINVAFKPTVPGARAGAITVLFNLPGNPQMVQLAGTGVADTIPPSISGPALTPPPSTINGVASAYLQNQAVTATYSCSDAETGVVSCGTATFNPAVNTTGNVVNPANTAVLGTQTFTVVAKDAAGNTSTQSVSYNVVAPDTTSPSISGPVLSPPPSTINGVPNAYLQNQTVTATYSCSDAGSGVVSCGTATFTPAVASTGSIVNSINTAVLGTQTFTVTAKDASGNTSTQSVSYNVAAAFSLADLAIAKVASPLVKHGSNLTYLIGAANLGPGIASNVVITDPLPAGTTFVKAVVKQVSCALRNLDDLDCPAPSTGTPCLFTNNTVTCNVGTLAPLGPKNLVGVAVVLVVNVNAPAGAVIRNTATVSASNPDPRVAHNAASAATAVTR